MRTSAFYHNLNRSHFDSLTVHSDLYGPVCHTTVASKSCCFNQSPCFIYLLVFLQVVMVSLGLYCPQSTTTVPVKSDWLCFYSEHGDKQQKIWPQIPAGRLPEGTADKDRAEKIYVVKMFHDTMHSNGKKLCYTSIVLAQAEKRFYWLACVPKGSVRLQCCGPTHVSAVIDLSLHAHSTQASWLIHRARFAYEWHIHHMAQFQGR